MSANRLVFVPDVANAPDADVATRIVVLDTSWTPGPSDRRDLVPLRSLAADALSVADLFDEARAALDTWCDHADAVERLTFDELTYWFRLREEAWHWLHERLIWLRVLGSAAAAAPPASISIPVGEPGLRDAAAAWSRAHGCTIEVPPDSPPAGTALPEKVSGEPSTVAPIERWVRRLLGRRREAPGREPTSTAARTALLTERLAAMRRRRDPVLVLSNARLHQRIGAGESGRPQDPNLQPVIAELADGGLDAIIIGLGLDHRRDADWGAITADPRLLPQSILETWRSPNERDPALPDRVRARVAGAAAVPLMVDAVDLAPEFVEWATRRAMTVVATTSSQLARIGGLLDEIRPRAVVLTHEGIQTAWLQAATKRAIPTFAVQHGIIYAGHPGYCHPRDPRRVLPSVTFVTGRLEQDVLLEHGGYQAREVVVAGSPRLTSGDALAGPLADEERARVRRELGIADGHLMLVVSTTFLAFHRRFVLATSLARLFGAPLPGVHVVFKQHPGETDEGPYRQLLEGLARAGGFVASPVTVVRDIDLFRLLRAADAHLGLYSTVLTEAVAAGIPNLIAVDQAHADLLGYVAAGVARPVRDAAELRGALADLRPPGESERQAFLAGHYEAGDASARIVARIRAWSAA